MPLCFISEAMNYYTENIWYSFSKYSLHLTFRIIIQANSRRNKSADDAAGLAISEKMRGQVRSIRQDIRNGNDGISLIQTAEGGMNEIGNILTRFRELSIQAASDTVGDVERKFIDKEVQQLKK